MKRIKTFWVGEGNYIKLIEKVVFFFFLREGSPSRSEKETHTICLVRRKTRKRITEVKILCLFFGLGPKGRGKATPANS